MKAAHSTMQRKVAIVSGLFWLSWSFSVLQERQVSPRMCCVLEVSAHEKWERLGRVRSMLASSRFHGMGVSSRLLRGRHVWAPTVLVRRDAWSMTPPKAVDELDTLISLFCLGSELSIDEILSKVRQPLIDELDEVGLLTYFGAKAHAPIALSPVGDALLIATDFAPGRIKLDESCYYLGPDSLALADVARRLAALLGGRVCDLCAGSGVQALVALASGAQRAIAVEPQPRAAAFCRFNAALNARVLAAVAEPPVPAEAPSTMFDIILANPPFVAVPADVAYDVFADGGPTGERVLADIVQFAADYLAPGGVLAVVCEVHGAPARLASEIRRWWTATDQPRLAVLTEPPSDRSRPEAVAARRVRNNPVLKAKWAQNYLSLKIDSISNGFVLLSRGDESPNKSLRSGDTEHATLCIQAPRLWAPPPVNREARTAVSTALNFLLPVKKSVVRSKPLV